MTNGEHNKKLDSAQKKAVAVFIEQQAGYRFSVHPFIVKACGERILKLAEKDGKDAKLSRKQSARFIKRHDYCFKNIKTISLDINRKAAQDPATIQHWFEMLKKAITDYSYTSDCIWNFDETSFCISMIGSIVVIVPLKYKIVYISQPGNRELVTCIKCISVAGKCISSFLVLKGKVIIKRWFKQKIQNKIA